MRVTIEIPLSNIIIPGKNYLPLNPKAMMFALNLLQGHKFPPVNLARNGDGNYELHGGRHRFAAHKLIGRKTILAHVAIPEEPYPYKPLQVALATNKAVPQADGCGLPHGTCYPE